MDRLSAFFASHFPFLTDWRLWLVALLILIVLGCWLVPKVIAWHRKRWTYPRLGLWGNEPEDLGPELNRFELPRRKDKTPE